MKSEQMGLMKVIQFPSRKIEEKEFRERKDKLEVAYKMLECLVGYGAEFAIVIKTEEANQLLEINEKQFNKYKYVTLTSNYELYKDIDVKKSMFYEIKGDEF